MVLGLMAILVGLMFVWFALSEMPPHEIEEEPNRGERAVVNRASRRGHERWL
jgi:hypothetical protein